MPPPPCPVIAAALFLTGCGTLYDLLLAPGVPNPFEGDGTLQVELRCDPASAAAASSLVGARLELLDLDHSVTAQPSGALSITATGVDQVQATTLADLLIATPELGFHAMVEDQGLLRPGREPPEEAVLDAMPTLGGRPDLAFDVEGVQAMLAMAGGPLPPVVGARIVERYGEGELYAAPPGTDWQPWLMTLPLPEGTAVVTECWQELGEDELCAPLLVETPAPVTAEHVESSELAMDDQSMGAHLELRFDDPGKQAFLELSERLVGRYLVIVSDGQVLSRPIVTEPIPGGRAWLTLGYGMDEQDLLDLWRFHAVLETGALPGECAVANPEVAP